MKNIDDIKNRLINGSLSIEEAQSQLIAFMYQLHFPATHPTDINRLEQNIRNFADQFELILHTIEADHQLAAALKVLDEAALFTKTESFEIEMPCESAMVINEFFSDLECRSLIELAEQKGFEDALIISGGKPILAREIRNNTRVIFDDEQLAKHLWNRLKGHVSIAIDDWKPVRLNERFRVYRYEPRQSFRLHKDFPYETANQKSHLSLIIYLNDEFEGGETRFRDFTIDPKTGRAVLFKHELLHEGSTVKAGIKYAVRTDVMFEQKI